MQPESVAVGNDIASLIRQFNGMTTLPPEEGHAPSKMSDPSTVPSFIITLTLENGREFKDVIRLDTKQKIEVVQGFLALLHTSTKEKMYSHMLESIKK